MEGWFECIGVVKGLVGGSIFSFEYLEVGELRECGGVLLADGWGEISSLSVDVPSWGVKVDILTARVVLMVGSSCTQRVARGEDLLTDQGAWPGSAECQRMDECIEGKRKSVRRYVKRRWEVVLVVDLTARAVR